jgi:hypothetical protein
MLWACAVILGHRHHEVHAIGDLRGMGWNRPSFEVEELLAEAGILEDCAGSKG